MMLTLDPVGPQTFGTASPWGLTTWGNQFQQMIAKAWGLYIVVLKKFPGLLSAITWHHYYLNGRTATLRQESKYEVLDLFGMALILKMTVMTYVAKMNDT